MDGEISPDAVNDLLDTDADVRIVDIRSERAFRRGHIPGSENLPFHRLPSDVDRLAGADRVVTVCPKGESSVQAARLIQSYEGIDADARVESMAGGLDAWEYEMERDGGDGSDGTSESPF